jgi:glycerophosphoryl diester phosphodiesterase
VDLGPRPHYLVEDMKEGPLKRALQQCSEDDMQSTEFSIGHRGACLQFPEHTRESYVAAARMGAGVIECDVTFTRDLELVCRHSQCDLHTTTNILTTPLASKCSGPFTGAVLSPNGAVVTPASARCCTSDLTLAEFRTLEGKMDAYDPAARTPEEYTDATPSWRTDLYAFPHHEGRWGGTLMTHAESIELFESLGVGMTPELKSPSVKMPFGGLTQAAFAQKMIDAYKEAGVPPERVWPQSFRLDDILYLIENEPAFARQAVFLDGRNSLDPEDPTSWSPTMEELTDRGVRILAPPIWMLLKAESGRIVPSAYARRARASGLGLIAWTLERPGPLRDGGGSYYRTVRELIDRDGDQFEVLDVLGRDVGVLGVFSDWPAAVTYYGNCMKVGPSRGEGR